MADKKISQLDAASPLVGDELIPIVQPVVDPKSNKHVTIDDILALAVSSFNGRIGPVTLTTGDVTTALGYTPYDSANPAAYISTITGIAAGGDLSGTYPNPTVAKFDGQLPSYYLLTTNITEGSNLYFTTARVLATALSGLSITGGSISSTDTILQAFGKVQNQINGLVGGVSFQGVWNATANSPTLTSSSGTKGYYYVVSVAGGTNLDGITDWKVGDWAIFNGTTWDKVDNTDAISSFNGNLGAIVYTPTGTSNRIDVSGASGLTPTFDISATYVGQTSITTLGTIATGSIPFSLVTGFNNLTVDNSSLQLDSGTTFNGSAAKTISVKALGITNSLIANTTIDLTTKVTGLLPYANFSNGGGLSVVGRSANTSGVQADITGTNNQVLRVSGTALGFGSIDLSQSATVGSSILGVGNGGSGTSTTFTSGSVIFAGASGVYSQNNAKFFWNDSAETLFIGTNSTVFTGVKLNSIGTTNSYLQNNIQNISNGAVASSDWIATADDGTDSDKYIDIGINSSGWSGTGMIDGQRQGYIYTKNVPLSIGTDGSVTLKLFTGGTGSSNERLSITSSGAQTFTAPTNGSIFTSTWTATANNQSAFEYTGTITSRNTASDTINYLVIDPTLARNAGNPATQVASAVTISPTFSNTFATQYISRFQNAASDRVTIGFDGATTITSGNSSTNPTLGLVGIGSGTNYTARFFQSGGSVETFSVKDNGLFVHTATVPASLLTSTWTASANSQIARSYTDTLTMRATASDTITANYFNPTITLGSTTQNPIGLNIDTTFVQTGGVSTTAAGSSTTSGMTATTYTGIAPASTSGSGTGALFTVVVGSATSITSITQTTPGSGYKVNETITFNGSQFGSGSGSATYTIVSVTGVSLGTTATAMRVNVSGANGTSAVPKLIDFYYEGVNAGSIRTPAGGGLRWYDGAGNEVFRSTAGVLFVSGTLTSSAAFAAQSTSAFSSTATFGGGASIVSNYVHPVNGVATSASIGVVGTWGGIFASNNFQSKFRVSATIGAGTSGVGIPSAISLTTGGTGYTTGGKSTTGGTGTGFQVTVNTVSAGVITAVSFATSSGGAANGSGYTINDILTVSGGTGGTITVTAVDYAGAIISYDDVASITDAFSNNKYYSIFQRPTYNITSTQVGTIAALYFNPTLTATGSFNKYGVIIGPSSFLNGLGTLTPSANLHVLQGVFTSGWVPGLRVDAGAHTGLTAATEFIANDFRAATQTWVDGTVTTQRYNYFRAFTANKTTTSATFTDIYNVFHEKSIAGSGVTFTRNWGIGTDGNLQVQGSAYIGAASVAPTALLHLAAGTTSVAPQRFTSGTLATGGNILAGNMEFLTDDYYLTITTGTARKNITLWDTLGTSGRVPYATTNGRLIDDASLLYDTTNGIQTTKHLKLTAAGGAIYIKQGSNATCGRATLSGGTVVVNTTAVATADEIFLTDRGGTVTNLGTVYISAVSAGTSFTITSTNILDASDVSWLIVKAA